MKKFLTALIFCLVTAAVYFQPIEPTAGQGGLAADPLRRAFQVSGAAPYELNVQGWARINNEYLTFDKLGQVVLKTKTALGIKDKFTRETTRQQDMRGITAIKELSPGEYVLVIAQTVKAGTRGETYLIITLSRGGNFNTLPTYREKISRVFREFKKPPRISTWLTGTLEGKLSPAEGKRLLKNMFAAAGVHHLDGISSENIVSLSGYSSLIDDYVTVGRRKVNLNIALRYHVNDGKTYVYLGSPLLDGEY